MALVARFVPFDGSRVAATYGGGTYGGGTYGEEASDPLSNRDFVLAPAPGQYPSELGWEFRVGDVGSTFAAKVVGVDGLLALSPFAQAVLVIERVSVGPRVCKGFGMTIDDVNDKVTYDWRDGDLDDAGMYAVMVQFVSDSGRPLTVDGNDLAAMVVRGGA